LHTLKVEANQTEM